MHLSQHVPYVDLISALIKSTSRSTLLNWQLHAWQESPWAEVPAGESTSRTVANGRIESIVTTADWFAFLGMLSHKSLLFISTGLLPVGVDWFLPIQCCVYCTYYTIHMYCIAGKYYIVIHVHKCSMYVKYSNCAVYMHTQKAVHNSAVSSLLNTSNTAWKCHCCADVDKVLWKHW